MALEPGQDLGQYAILSPLGAGGMGEVYRARDSKLGREVAIKVLPERIYARSFTLRDGQVSLPPVAEDQRLAELQAEARVLAALNHPNVATLFGFEAHDHVSYLVMELVEGKTLAEKLRHGPLPIREAVRIFIQIADGLEAAHERGIAHCDLKPQNVMVTPQGAVKILDFGVARVLAGPGSGAAPDPYDTPTLTQPVVGDSAGMGTIPYLSPEQARGLRGDTGADIWSFGCCLYEALTGKRAFFAGTVPDILVKILDREPEWEALPRETPLRLRILLRRCLAKETAGRLRHIGDAGLELRDVLDQREGVDSSGEPSDSSRRRRTAVHWLAAAAVGAAVGATAAMVVLGGARGTGRERAPAEVRRFSLNLPADHPLQPSLPISLHRGLALSSDGRLLVYVGQSGETTQLFRRSLDSVESEPIAGTEGAWYPFFSPDDRWVGFFDRQSRTLEKVSLGGGLPEVLANIGTGLAATSGLGASWGADGSIVYCAVGPEGLLRVSENGGTPSLVSARAAAGELYRGFPSHLPGDRGVLVMYASSLGSEHRKVGHVNLETGELTPLLEPASMPRYVPTGHIVFSQDRQLMAAPFDLDTLVVTGPAVRITEPRMQAAAAQPLEWDASDDGTLVFATAGESLRTGRAAIWVDRGGGETELGLNPVADTDWARLSPDGARVVYGSVDDQHGNWDIYLYSWDESSNRRLTFETLFDSHPIFHPDGKRVLYSSVRDGARRIVELDPTRGGPRVLSEDVLGFPHSLSPDGGLVFFERPAHGPTREDVGVLSRAEGRATLLLESAARERYPSLSPDGRWLAYESDSSGRAEIYVRPFPAFDATYQVSSEGGNFPVWGAAGDQIYYRRGRALVSVAIDTSDGFAVASTQVLFDSPFDVENYYFDVAPDGQHFLMLRPAVRGVRELIVVENWFEELKRLVPTG
jgi:eukaryotic-like serine/threonine-protein kinase